jgi:hypothetical protein
MALFISPMKNVILEYQYIYFLRTILSFNEDKAKYLIYKYKKMYIHCREYYTPVLTRDSNRILRALVFSTRYTIEYFIGTLYHDKIQDFFNGD